MPKVAAARLQQLRQELAEHAHAYYVLDHPTVSDAAYDRLFAELLEIEAAHPEWVVSSSPSQRVGAKIPSGGLASVSRVRPMLSLSNIFTSEDLAEFDARLRRALSMGEAEPPLDYAVEPKVDGLSIELTYRKGQLVLATTRGDGVTGEDVTQNARTIAAIPLQLRPLAPGKGLPWPEQLEVRGEVYFPKAAFATFNRQRQEEGATPFANPRNAAAGSLRQLDPKITATRPLRAVFYGLSAIALGDAYPAGHLALCQWLKACGLPVLPTVRVCGVAALQQAVVRATEQRHSHPYEVDGAVIKVDDHRLQDELGYVARAPRWAIAFKMAAQQELTVVEDIQVRVGRTGSLNPLALLRPVAVGGVTISRATLHNSDELARKDVRIGDSVWVRRAGDVIPEVVMVEQNLRPAQAQAFVFPAHCPECQSVVKRLDEEVVWRCFNMACPAQARERLMHFVSRKAMDIVGLGERQIAELFERQLLHDVTDIYRLQAAALLALPRRQQKSVDKLLAGIQASKTRSLGQVIFALGIRHVGEHVAKVLATHLRSLPALLQASQEDLEALYGIGPEVASSVVAFAADASNRARIEALLAFGVAPTLASAEALEPTFKGMTFVLTGTLRSMSREQAQEAIVARGGRAASSVSSRTTFVVLGEAAGSKAARAKELEIKCLDEAAFLAML